MTFSTEAIIALLALLTALGPLTLAILKIGHLSFRATCSQNLDVETAPEQRVAQLSSHRSDSPSTTTHAGTSQTASSLKL